MALSNPKFGKLKHMSKGFFIAATGQNVGKTTTCLGLLAGLKKRHKSVGFLKPVGQEHVETEDGVSVDKDVILFKKYFDLEDSYEEMSPVLFPKGFTRDYLDGKIKRTDLIQKIENAWKGLSSRHDLVIVEGTGHTGVGSVVDLNNAQVASLLGLRVILVAPGGLGSSFDDLMLNYVMCQHFGVDVAGVILNRVLDEKREMVIKYMTKTLKKLGVPLLGSIPFDPFLSAPSMQDFAALFKTELLTGKTHLLRHFDDIRLVATSVELYQTMIIPNQLIITPAGREDIILATLVRTWDLKISHPEEDVALGIILTGKQPPKKDILEQIQKADLPMIHVPLSSFAVMKMINTTTSKIRKEDTAKIKEAIQVVESHIDFDTLLTSTN